MNQLIDLRYKIEVWLCHTFKVWYLLNIAILKHSLAISIVVAFKMSHLRIEIFSKCHATKAW
jgi:hypothetical protein